LLAAADIVVIPQLATETARYQMPMKVYDAMAMGKPIVASAVSDLPALLDGCALLVPPSDVTQLTTAIADLLRDPDKGRLLGEQARRRIKEEFSLKHVSEKLAQVVHGVADSFPKRPNDETQ
jgi:glycosyltransferase involved in cell wall biosynthesis